MEEETLDLQYSIRVEVDEHDQPPDYPAPPPPSPPLSLQLSYEQILNGFSIDRLIKQMYSSARSSNSASSHVGEATEMADLHATVASDEENPMFTVDIGPRTDGSEGYEQPLPPTVGNGQFSWLRLMILIFIYLVGVCITVVITVLIVLIFLPDLYECIMHTSP